MRLLASSPTDMATMAGATSTETRFMTLISGLMAGPAVSLNGSPTVSPMIGRSSCDADLAAVLAVLDQLLGVVPCAAGVGQEHRHQRARRDRAAEVARQRSHTEAEPDSRDRRQLRRAVPASPTRAASRG